MNAAAEWFAKTPEEKVAAVRAVHIEQHDSDDEAFDAEVTALTDAWMADANKLYEAEQWVAGTHDCTHYREVTLALAAFHDTHPADLSGSDALARVYRIAKVEHEALYVRMRDMAERELQK